MLNLKRALSVARPVAFRGGAGVRSFLRRFSARRHRVLAGATDVYSRVNCVIVGLVLGAGPMGEKRFAQVFSLSFARLGRVIFGASLASQLVYAFAIFADFVSGRAVEMALERNLRRSFGGRDGHLHWRGQPSVLGLRG